MGKNEYSGIVLSTYNNGEAAVKCVKSCMEQDDKFLYIIAADDGSSDDTLDKLKEAAGEDPRFILLKLEHGERGTARAMAIERAKACGISFLMIIDSDMVLESGLVGKCKNYFIEHPEVGALVIPEIPFTTYRNFYSKVKVFERSILNNAGTELGRNSIEAARFWRIDAYDSTGGLNPFQISFEETQPTIRYLEKGGIIKRAVFTGVTHDEKKVTLRNLLAKKKYYFSVMNRTFSTEEKGSKKALQRWYFFRPVLYRRDNLKRYLRHPLLTLGMVFMYVCLTGIGVWEVLKTVFRR